MLIIYMFSSYKRSFNYLLRREMQITLQQSEGKNGGNRRGKWKNRGQERERDSNIKYKIEGVGPLS